MNYFIQVFGNLIAPTLAGTIFFLFFLYFTLTFQTRTMETRSLAVYLLSFSLFLIGRPLQLLAGSPVTALIINNIRVFFFSAVVFPNILTINSQGRRNRLYYGIGVLVGLIHVTANTLGTRGTYLLLNMGSVQLRDLNTPSGLAPFYGREITIYCSVLLGIIIAVSAFVRLLSVYRRRPSSPPARDRRNLLHISIFLFGFSFVIGAAIKQWWVYYIFSVISAFTLTLGVFLEMKQIQYRMGQVIPLLKDNILQNITFSHTMEKEIAGMLEIMGVRGTLNLFMVVKIFRDFQFYEKNELALFNLMEEKLLKAPGRDRFVIIPISANIIGICLALTEKDEGIFPVHLAEEIRESLKETFEVAVNIGIGQRYRRLFGLRFSYREAFDSLNAAEKLGTGMVLQAEAGQTEDPCSSGVADVSMEKEEILQSIRTGSREAAGIAVNSYLEKIRNCPEGSMDIMKGRLFELLGLMIDAGIALGADESALLGKSVDYFRHIEKLTGSSYLEKKLHCIVEEIFALSNAAARDRSGKFVRQAKTFIQENYYRPLTVKETADQVNLSPSYFQHLFKNETDLSFVDYLTKIRIARAEELLVKGSKPISDIAFSVGFDDSNYFSKVFKQKTGLSPRDYRKEKTPV